MEKLMQYVWQYRLWLPADMATVDGTRVDVLDPGLLNTDAGPDFFNAKIRIGDKLWAGNVEIHVRASDWYRHGHHNDRAYDTVVLHVVERDDARIKRSDGEEIPQIVMPCAANFSETYHRMVDDRTVDLPCARIIASMPHIYITDWVSALGFERLCAKSDRVLDAVRRAGGDWQQAIYVTLARALGFGTNSDPFERVALATPLRTLMRHRDDRVTVEGALFGQAGFLDNIPDNADPYLKRLRQDYEFTAAKYGYVRPLSPGWKMSRMRPQNFPPRRIAALAAMVSGGFGIGSKIFTVRTLEDARALFDFELNAFWQRRYSFEAEAPHPIKTLSKSSVNSLIINVVAPVLHAYGIATGHTGLSTTAVDILHAVEAENNVFVRMFTSAGIDCPDAFTSQALVQLRRNYCESRKCLYCRIGHRYLACHAIRRS